MKFTSVESPSIPRQNTIIEALGIKSTSELGVTSCKADAGVKIMVHPRYLGSEQALMEPLRTR